MARFVLVHGGFSGAWIWLPLMDRLKADGPVVEAFDLPGMGNDNTSASEVSLDNYAGRVCEVLAASSEPGIVVALREIGHWIMDRLEEQEDVLAIGDPVSSETYTHSPTQRLDIQKSPGQRLRHEEPADCSRC